MRYSANQFGFVASLIIHLFIFIIPISGIVNKNREVVEFFVSIEEAYRNPEIVKVKRDVVRQVEKEKKVFKNVDKEVEPERPVEKIVKENVEEIPVKPVISERLRDEPESGAITPQQDVITKIASVDKGLENKEVPIDTEFGSAVAPSFLHKEIPEYPVIARKLGKEGKVVLRLTINERGELINIEVIERAGYGFTESAIEAVKKSTFLPAKKNGVPIMSRAMLPIKFVLRRN